MADRHGKDATVDMDDAVDAGATLQDISAFVDQSDFNRLVELAARMPIELKYRRGIGKRILLETFSDIIPATIARRKKMGFGVPLDAWFRGPLVEMSNSVLLDRKSLDRGFFRPETIRGLLEDHQQGRFDHSYRLWSLLVLELWLRRWVD